ncbi:glutamate-cysteine ligase family protein [Actinocorallia herbida]|uniref:glutamate-cysteine ligase family protein n=1 Tax=Actinocorallia herbida TaxID=58109 RepID=UPI000F4C613D|nr:glutamate-cysteine ligase family protein [Actinocorallia herbida]
MELVGVEIEVGVVDPRTGVSRPYAGERGVAALLELIARRWPGTAVVEEGSILGFRRDDGAEIMLESGCALEYGSPPAVGLVALVRRVRADLADLAALAHELDLALLSGALLPYDPSGHRTWAPKPQIPLMLDFFRAEFGTRSTGWAAMSRILSVQTTLDYTDTADRDAKHRTANLVSPLVAALFVNSPVWEGALTERLSHRLHVWAGVDARRTGYLPHALGDPLDLDKFLDAITGLAPIFRKIAGKAAPVPPGRSFRYFLDHGYGDGSYPTEEDWTALLSTLWPFVRLRRTLELRVADGPGHADWPAIPALWTGLLYDEASRAEAADLMRDTGRAELDALTAAVAEAGPAASFGGTPLRTRCADLVRIAKEGLARQVVQGLEDERALAFLEPVEAVAATGVPPAARLAEAWPARYAHDPATYVADHRYR